MPEAFVTVERRPDDIALVRLDRPKANALSAAVLAQLHAVATELHDDPPGAVVLWGGRRIFAAGADIVELGDGGAGAVGASFAEALARWPRSPGPPSPPSTATPSEAGSSWPWPATSGSAPRTPRFGLPEVLLGVIPAGRHAAAAAADRVVRAKELIFTGRQVRSPGGPGDRAGQPGRGARRVLEEALTWAAQLVPVPLVAHRLAKAAVDRGLRDAGRGRPSNGGLRRRGRHGGRGAGESRRSTRTGRAKRRSSGGERLSSPPIPGQRAARARSTPARGSQHAVFYEVLDPGLLPTPTTTERVTCAACARSSTTWNASGIDSVGRLPFIPALPRRRVRHQRLLQCLPDYGIIADLVAFLEVADPLGASASSPTSR